MKKQFLLLWALFAGLGFLTSCSDNDDPTPEKLPEAATFTDATGLTLSVDGAAMPGKTAQFTPSADGKTATITLSSTFDLSMIPGYQAGMIEGDKLQAPGVIPGSPITELNVNLTADGDTYKFSGDESSTYCTYSYSGEVKDNSLSLSIKDVKLKNTSLAGTTWNLVASNPEDATAGPTHIVWEPYDIANPDASASIDLGIMKLPLQTILQLVTVMPMLENPTSPEGDDWSVNEMLNYLLESVTFLEDGNIIATYRDMERGQKVMTSPKNLVQYVIKANGELLIFLNPQAIAAADKTRALDLNSVLNQVMGKVLPMLANGVPVEYTQNGNNMSIYLGTELILPLLKSVVLPIVNDEETVEMIIGMIAGDEEMADMIPMIQSAIASLPGALEMTTKIEIGLNFTKK